MWPPAHLVTRSVPQEPSTGRPSRAPVLAERVASPPSRLVPYAPGSRVPTTGSLSPGGLPVHGAVAAGVGGGAVSSTRPAVETTHRRAAPQRVQPKPSLPVSVRSSASAASFVAQPQPLAEAVAVSPAAAAAAAYASPASSTSRVGRRLQAPAAATATAAAEPDEERARTASPPRDRLRMEPGSGAGLASPGTPDEPRAAWMMSSAASAAFKTPEASVRQSPSRSEEVSIASAAAAVVAQEPSRGLLALPVKDKRSGSVVSSPVTSAPGSRQSSKQPLTPRTPSPTPVSIARSRGSSVEVPHQAIPLVAEPQLSPSSSTTTLAPVKVGAPFDLPRRSVRARLAAQRPPTVSVVTPASANCTPSSTRSNGGRSSNARSPPRRSPCRQRREACRMPSEPIVANLDLSAAASMLNPSLYKAFGGLDGANGVIFEDPEEESASATTNGGAETASLLLALGAGSAPASAAEKTAAAYSEGSSPALPTQHEAAARHGGQPRQPQRVGSPRQLGARPTRNRAAPGVAASSALLGTDGDVVASSIAGLSGTSAASSSRAGVRSSRPLAASPGASRRQPRSGGLQGGIGLTQAAPSAKAGMRKLGGSGASSCGSLGSQRPLTSQRQRAALAAAAAHIAGPSDFLASDEVRKDSNGSSGAPCGSRSNSASSLIGLVAPTNEFSAPSVASPSPKRSWASPPRRALSGLSGVSEELSPSSSIHRQALGAALCVMEDSVRSLYDGAQRRGLAKADLSVHASAHGSGLNFSGSSLASISRGTPPRNRSGLNSSGLDASFGSSGTGAGSLSPDSLQNVSLPRRPSRDSSWSSDGEVMGAVDSAGAASGSNKATRWLSAVLVETAQGRGSDKADSISPKGKKGRQYQTLAAALAANYSGPGRGQQASRSPSGSKESMRANAAVAAVVAAAAVASAGTGEAAEEAGAAEAEAAGVASKSSPEEGVLEEERIEPVGELDETTPVDAVLATLGVGQPPAADGTTSPKGTPKSGRGAGAIASAYNSRSGGSPLPGAQDDLDISNAVEALRKSNEELKRRLSKIGDGGKALAGLASFTALEADCRHFLDETGQRGGR
eukprot:TRINITY_DN39805_c0_g1_i1.p1 TRINITY_DN39805_c0_g1~~TRINITY_DN39805_c0_g1_i1.p1  ORF type:complete len:1076 (-),score=202.59 TRINITY_DN39805_c0_g1_i1:94-3321(-)